jgi:hypothetical protein
VSDIVDFTVFVPKREGESRKREQKTAYLETALFVLLVQH